MIVAKSGTSELIELNEKMKDLEKFYKKSQDSL
jgi:hypothetical protein